MSAAPALQPHSPVMPRSDALPVPASRDRLAWGVLLLHVLFVTFGAIAFVTVLSGDYPELMASESAAQVYAWSMRLAPATTVYLGALAALAHSLPRIGTTRALVLFGTASVIALLSELGGTNVGLPFGPYHYTEMLGWKVAGDVPLPIPVSWYFMLYGCLAICARLMRAGDDGRTKWRWAVAAGFLLTFWDIPQDPAMTAVNPVHWAWDFDRFPAWVPGWMKTGFFYGMPLSNWIGWLVTGTLIARVMVWILPPTAWRARVAGSPLPILLYAAGGIMPLAVCVKHGMWWAVVPGALLMYVPVLLALRTATGDRRPATGVGAVPVPGLAGD